MCCTLIIMFLLSFANPPQIPHNGIKRITRVRLPIIRPSLNMVRLFSGLFFCCLVILDLMPWFLVCSALFFKLISVLLLVSINYRKLFFTYNLHKIK